MPATLAKIEIDWAANILGDGDVPAGKHILAEKLGVTVSAIYTASQEQLVPARWYWPIEQATGRKPNAHRYAWAKSDQKPKRPSRRPRAERARSA